MLIKYYLLIEFLNIIYYLKNEINQNSTFLKNI